tara:strand:+ start:1524 stop:1865 length:342 start_codon:yes stop_codon:yes gene_type:complete
MARKRRTFKEKQNWILALLEKRWEFNKRTQPQNPRPPMISATDEETEEEWHDEFGGQRRYYTLGPHVSPDFARTLRAMYANGILYRGTMGNQDAKNYCQKTYFVFYKKKSHCH